MKKNFIINTFIIFLLSSFNIFAQRVVDTDKLEYNQKTQLFHYGNEKEPFTGIEKAYYEDKSLKYELPYKNGKFDGKSKEYYPNGKLESETFYLNG